MPNQVAFGLIAMAFAGVAAAQPAGVLAIRHGYALPSDTSAAAQPLPRAYPPGRPQFYQDLDLPLAGDYQEEVLRYTVTGVTPTLVVQFAVARPRRPVQVLVERASGLGHLKEATRAFGEIAWPDFDRLKGLAMPLLLAAPAAAADEPAAGEVTVTAVDQVCTLEYAGGGLSVRRRMPCDAEGAMQDAREALVETAMHAAGPPR